MFRSLLAGLACVAAGCHGYRPLPLDLPAHAEAFALRLPVTAHAEGLSRQQGRRFAMLFHPQARLARRRAGIAEVDARQAGRWIDPKLNAGLQQSFDGRSPFEWTAATSLGFTLPINGRLQKARELAGRRHERATVEAWATEQRIAHDLDRAWIDWSADTARVALFETLCAGLAELEQTAAGLADAGVLTRPGARVFELERAQREIELAGARATAHIGELELKRRLGLHPQAPARLVADLDVAPFHGDPGLRRRRLAQSPALRALELGHRSAEAKLALEVRKQFPDLTLWPGWSAEDGNSIATVGLQLPLPLFTGNDPAIARATAERELTATAFRAGYEDLVQRLAIAEQGLELARLQLRQLDQRVLPLAQRQIEDGRQLAEAGQFDPLLVLDGLLRAHDTRMRMLTARTNASAAAIDINRLLADPTTTPHATAEGDRP